MLLEQRNREHGPDAFGLVILDWMLPGMNGLEAAERIRSRPETRTLPIILLSAYAGREEEERGAALGVNVFLQKPITASSFFDAIVQSQGARVHACRRALDAPLEREFDGLRALLAEDNEANQMVAVELLARLGIQLDVASNGREAVEMVRAGDGRYAAVFMDMQMPELDGLGATRLLRADPRFSALPIIAMTANAMKGDLEACRAAGMDDHVTKPIDRRALVRTLRRWLKAPAASGDDPRGPAHPDAHASVALEGFEIARTLDRLGLEWNALQSMLVRFGESIPAHLADLGAAVDAGDAGLVRASAHALAGAAGNLGAATLGRAARALESAAQQPGADLRSPWLDLEGHARVVLRSLHSLRAEREVEAPGQAFDVHEASAALDSLLIGLEEFDTTAVAERLANLAGQAFPREHDTLLAALRAQAEGYEYDQAADTARRLRDQLRGAVS